jgi:hypothetical protein
MAQFTDAVLRAVDFSYSNLSEADFGGATLEECRIYATSTWALRIDKTSQNGLIITRPGDLTVTVDSVVVGQFIHLLLNNDNLRDVIDTVSKKAVLILGSFEADRLKVLESIRAEVRKLDMVPIIFTFQGSPSRDLSDTVRLLAGMSRIVIADLTDPRSVPAELEIVKDIRVSIAPIILCGQSPPALTADLLRRSAMAAPLYEYADEADLLMNLRERVIGPALAKYA